MKEAAAGSRSVIPTWSIWTGRWNGWWANNEDDVVDPWEITNGAKGYNRTARHIVYVGGVERDGKTPRDTRTSEQRGALEAYVKDFHRRFPHVRIVGHNELAAKACPSFDVQEWLFKIGINNNSNVNV